MIHVPYKGSTPATQAILSNDILFLFSSLPPAVANVGQWPIAGARGDLNSASKRRTAGPDDGRSGHTQF
jgi:hypothetical protein